MASMMPEQNAPDNAAARPYSGAVQPVDLCGAVQRLLSRNTLNRLAAESNFTCSGSDAVGSRSSPTQSGRSSISSPALDGLAWALARRRQYSCPTSRGRFFFRRALVAGVALSGGTANHCSNDFWPRSKASSPRTTLYARPRGLLIKPLACSRSSASHGSDF